MTASKQTILLRLALFLLIAMALLYAGDFISLHLRMRHATSTNPFETLTAPRVLAISEKGNKTEYQIDAENPTQTVTCVHALFPHNGYSTCWQVQRTLHQPVPM
jgi:hypothetical protein